MQSHHGLAASSFQAPTDTDEHPPRIVPNAVTMRLSPVLASVRCRTRRIDKLGVTGSSPVPPIPCCRFDNVLGIHGVVTCVAVLTGWADASLSSERWCSRIH
jgi:hypothetical protein